MTVFEDIKGSFDSVLSGGQGAEGLSSDAQFLIITFAIILAAVLILLLVVALRYKSQQYSILRKEMEQRDVSWRRRIRQSDKHADEGYAYLTRTRFSSATITHARYAEYQETFWTAFAMDWVTTFCSKRTTSGRCRRAAAAKT